VRARTEACPAWTRFYLRVAGDHDLIVEIPFPWEQAAAAVIVNRLLPIDGIQDARPLVAIAFPEPDEEDRDQFSAWS
jgi:hypothetical protein